MQEDGGKPCQNHYGKGCSFIGNFFKEDVSKINRANGKYNYQKAHEQEIQAE